MEITGEFNVAVWFIVLVADVANVVVLFPTDKQERVSLSETKL